MNHILERDAELLEDADDVLVDDRGLLSVVIGDTIRELAGCRIGSPLRGDVCDGRIGWNYSDGRKETFVGWGTSGSVEVLERHFD